MRDENKKSPSQAGVIPDFFETAYLARSCRFTRLFALLDSFMRACRHLFLFGLSGTIFRLLLRTFIEDQSRWDTGFLG
jgi:hypothetical protein